MHPVRHNPTISWEPNCRFWTWHISWLLKKRPRSRSLSGPRLGPRSGPRPAPGWTWDLKLGEEGELGVDERYQYVAVGDWFHIALPEHSVSESGVFFLLFFFFPCFRSPLLSALSLLRVSVALSFLPTSSSSFCCAKAPGMQLSHVCHHHCKNIPPKEPSSGIRLPVVVSCFGCCFPSF